MAADQELLKAVKGILNILTTGQTKNLSSQTTNNATSQNNTTESSVFNYSTDRLTEYKRIIKEIEDETAQIRDNVFGYETVYKRIDRLNKESVRLHEELKKLKKEGKDTTQKEYQIAQNLLNIERESAKLKIDGYTKLDDIYER